MTVWDALVGQQNTVTTLQTAAAAAARIVDGAAAADADRPGRADVTSDPPGAGTADPPRTDIPATSASSPAATAGTRPAPSAMTHAWLFVGPPGSGRSVAARSFAAALQCERREVLGCGECAQCRTVGAGTHPDVHAVVPEGLSIGVTEMRSVVGRAARRPSLGRWQIILVEDADRLTEQASNALLKAIEEPPPRTVVLLCAPSLHPDDVLVTIRSRCRPVTLRTPPAAAVAQVLRAGGTPENMAVWAAAAGQGHIGRSRRLARDSAARAHRDEVLGIPASLTSLSDCLQAADRLVRAAEDEASSLAEEVDAAETASLQTALGAGSTGRGTAAAVRGSAGVLRELEKRQKSRHTRTQRDALDRALVDLAAFYRDVLLRHAGSTVAPAHPDRADDVASVVRRIDAAGALQRLDAVLACREALDLNVKLRIAVEAMTTALRLP